MSRGRVGVYLFRGGKFRKVTSIREAVRLAEPGDSIVNYPLPAQVNFIGMLPLDKKHPKPGFYVEGGKKKPVRFTSMETAKVARKGSQMVVAYGP